MHRGFCSESDAADFQVELHSTFEWGIFLNVDECIKVMHINNGNRRNVYIINGRVVQYEKNLGQSLDLSLTLSKQRVESAKTGNWILGLVRHHFKFLHTYVVRLYKQMLRPHLEYSCSDVESNFEKV